MKALLLFVLFGLASCGHFYPVQVTDMKIGPKKGIACSNYIMGFHTGGESHVLEAAKDGDIKNISTVDYSQWKGFFPFSYQNCTTVTGK